MTVVVVAAVALTIVATVVVMRTRAIIPDIVARAVAVGGGVFLLALTLTRIRVSTDAPNFAGCLAAVVILLAVSALMLFGGLKPRRRSPQ